MGAVDLDRVETSLQGPTGGVAVGLDHKRDLGSRHLPGRL
jgi:hypothetical protein